MSERNECPTKGSSTTTLRNRRPTARLGGAVLLMMLAFFAAPAAGASFFVPYIAPGPWKTVLVATNPTPGEQTVFVTYHAPDVVSLPERAYVVPPGSSIRLDLRAEAPAARSARVETDGSFSVALKVELAVGGAAVAGSPLPGVASQSLVLETPPGGAAAWTGIAVANLGDLADNLRISAYDANGLRIATTVRPVSLHGVTAGLITEWFPATDGIAYVRVEGSNRLQALTVSETLAGSFLSYPADVGPPPLLEPDPERTYFIVGRPAFGERPSESYVLGLSDPAHIAEARAILADPSLAKIVTGSIARGHGGYNRSLTEPGAPAWSWHIAGFEGFADLAAEVCDGRPSAVEFDLTYWVDTVGRICFWTPTIVRELTLDEVRTGVLGAASP